MNRHLIPKGFKFSGIASGIKKSLGKDLGLIYSEEDCIVSAAFTSNKVQAAHIALCKKNLKNKVRALVVNSGNANCFTGKQGLRDAYAVTDRIAGGLGVNKNKVLMASTGIIGVKLPKERILSHTDALISNLSAKRLSDFSSAILTTDKFSKVKSTSFSVGGKSVVICGIAKGAGMIYPSLKLFSFPHATMLCFILTDICLGKALLGKALNQALDISFNSITVDGCMSTNDSVFILGNGLAGNKVINSDGKDFNNFRRGLNLVCSELAKMIVADAEGATKFITIKIEKAESIAQAKRAAFAIANSNLFKCAIYGSDPNWGRIIAALGASSVDFNRDGIDLYINDKPLLLKNRIVENKNKITGTNVTVKLVLNKGQKCWSVYTSDLTPGYININSKYN